MVAHAASPYFEGNQLVGFCGERDPVLVSPAHTGEATALFVG